MAANEDGTGERVLASHRGDLWFEGVPAWSPDGKTVAGFLGSWAGGMHYNLVAITVDNSKEMPISTFQWEEQGNDQGRVEWLRDGSGLICTGTEKRGSASQLWYCSYPGGAVQRITNDLNEYAHASLTADGKVLSAVQVARRSHIWVLPEGDVSKGEQVTNGKDEGLLGVSVAPDGKIVYTGSSGGNTDLWIMNRDGSNQRQLTSDPSMEINPAVSNDNRFVLFSSYRSGIPNIWRINIDGSQPRQLTGGGEDYCPDISPDSKWVVFRSWDAGPVLNMKISIDGGEPTRLNDKSGVNPPSFSPDGKRVAYSYVDEQRGSIQVVDIVDFSNGSLVSSMRLPSTAVVTNLSALPWTPDGRAISYIDVHDGVSNVWSQSLAGGPPKQITTFKSGIIYRHAWSRDGKTLVLSRGDVSSDAVLISNFRQP
jgi:Tol biopolymer transport system component